VSTLAPWLLSLALTWPSPPSHVEPAEERRERLAVAAGALAWAVDRAVMTGALPGRERRLWAALALATVRRESGNLDRGVHSGRRLGDRGRSICFGQINRGNVPAYGGADSSWRSLAGVGDDASRRCAWAVVSTLARARDYCLRKAAASELHGAVLSVYLRGHGCRVNREGRVRLALARQSLATLASMGD